LLDGLFDECRLKTELIRNLIYSFDPNIIRAGLKFPDNIVDQSFKCGKNLKIGVYNHIHENVRVGDDCTIRSFVELRPETVIGNNCYIDSGVKTSGQCRIGNNVTIRYDSIIARNVIIEDDVFISPQVMTINIPFTEKEKKPTIIRKNAKIGTNVTINDGVEIGVGVIIGAKAFVNKDCIESGVYVGAPAKKIR
jgi:UDP-N-acetylglucosamine acyltransferase